MAENFDDAAKLDAALRHLLGRISRDNVEIVSGGAKGADALGEEWARSNGYRLKVFPANRETHGRSAGPRRNVEMAEYADVLIAVWDGGSRGTRNMVERALEMGLEVHVLRYRAAVASDGRARHLT